MSPPVAIESQPRSEVACNSLVQTDNKLFNKVIIVFTYLCEEAFTLNERATVHLVPALLLLGEQPTTAQAAVDAALATPALAEARPEVVVSSALPLLLAVQQFVTRVNMLAVNLVRQLAALYSPQQRLFAATFRSVTMRRAFDALGQLFGSLIFIDDALQR